MKKQSRNLSSFNLSFLDIMFCGFGAVVLLVLIINANAITDNKKKYADLSSEVNRVKNEIQAAKIYHGNLQINLQEKQDESEKIQNDLQLINRTISELAQKSQLDKEQTLALKKHINALQSDIKKIDKNNWKKKQQIELSIKESGNKVRQYEGEGHRQYLTGLKLGGKRVLILIDSSASMLDETIVNIIVKRNLSDQVKKSAKKWQQAVNTVRWLVANLPASSHLMIVSFNKKAQSLSADQSWQWIKSTDKEQVNHLFSRLYELVPEQGTNLSHAFSIIRKMSQKPDNVILITDGLPTQGKKQSMQSKVTPSERIKLFQEAIKIIPARIPVNTILFPMEGDPMAAVLFWKLAIDSRGSFMTPSSDWP